MGKVKAVCENNTIHIHNRPVTRAFSYALLRASSKEVDATTQINKRRRTTRAALDEKKANAPKKRASLKDITNNVSYTSCFNTSHIQAEIKKRRTSSSKVASSSSSATSQVTHPNSRVVSLSDCTYTSLVTEEEEASVTCVGQSSTVASIPKFVDIDSDENDPLLCSLYASDIYYNLRVAELKRRPLPDVMETTQRDVTRTMRGILVDWIVEVSEEFKLVPDTLYLTVYLIDWYLHGNYIQRQRLQLLGITCILIASKYEEVCAPRIEELCYITDNTFTRDQVIEMERRVLQHFSFQIYTPTSKTFLRRFLRAAHASSHLNTSLEMEFLANYLTELTLMEYELLKLIPSKIAASAVFLAKWTMNQSNHPWNETLEHYTTYKASDLKESVQALRHLQLNTKGCPLISIRSKYRQDKFKSVAVFISPNLPDKLFY